MAFQIGENSKVQDLYNACSIVFSGYGGPPPTLEEIQWIQDFLGTMKAVDVGIDDDGTGEGDGEEEAAAVRSPSTAGIYAGLFPGLEVSEITYVHIHDCDEFSIGVFCFPAGARIPLHDHPEMVVLSKVLYGSVSVRSYDWVRAPDHVFRKCGLASVVVEDRPMKSSSPASVLFPSSGGNIHSFTALTPCAILDVLSPPYNDDQGRPSTYYSEIHIPSLPGFVILEEKDLPEDLVVTAARYVGPELVLDDSEDEDSLFY